MRNIKENLNNMIHENLELTDKIILIEKESDKIKKENDDLYSKLIILLL